ncbi:hypothetical protein GV819_04400 [Pseudomonas sp. Fl5BN2]|uniref:hypothetical protein n=1 Tax=unclassified Pseudomonas TaxID=196821 RepID=UPI001378EA92|nr:MULTISPECIES: hypothetical protein [unclassified Pseudomonas]NBF01526.1 hypothetical protein [Pseudomonas sp. Fl5BN2]NBF08417.1 hypothetical protein [Pseudomonas sp. Fl4BN1]
MKRTEARQAVYSLIRQWLGERTCLDDCSRLQALGLDKGDIEEMLWRLEDRFDLCVPALEEQRGISTAESVHDLIEWLLEMSRQNED